MSWIRSRTPGTPTRGLYSAIGLLSGEGESARRTRRLVGRGGTKSAGRARVERREELRVRIIGFWAFRLALSWFSPIRAAVIALLLVFIAIVTLPYMATAGPPPCHAGTAV